MAPGERQAVNRASATPAGPATGPPLAGPAPLVSPGSTPPSGGRAGATTAGPLAAPVPPAGPSAAPPAHRAPRAARMWVVALVSALVGALVAAGVSAAVLAPERDDDLRAPAAGPPITAADGSMDIQSILGRVQESVVTIEVSGRVGGGVFDGAGSGVVLSADGLVMTNAHVISDTDEITVRTFDGADYDASLVGSEPASDLAVIRVEGVDDLVPAELGSSGSLLVGSPVIAIGNALNLGGQPSVTTGIVSAVNRTIDSPDGGRLTDLIQTDTAINPGNSGGPLVDASGAVVGINTAIIQDSQNIGFAISIDSARPIIEQLQQGNGEITPDTPRLGVTTLPLDTVPDAVREQFEIEAEDGAFVDDVLPGSGADRAGIRAGDVIVAIDDQEITSNDQLGEIIGGHRPGDSIQITIERRGEEQTITAEIGRLGD